MKILPLLVAILSLGLAGCSSSDTAKSSPEEVKSFKGGPMPDSFKEKLAAQKNAGPPPGTPTGQ